VKCAVAILLRSAFCKCVYFVRPDYVRLARLYVCVCVRAHTHTVHAHIFTPGKKNCSALWSSSVPTHPLDFGCLYISRRSASAYNAITFPWYYTDRIEKDTPKNSSTVACVFVATGMYSSSRCLARIEVYTDTQIVRWSHNLTFIFLKIGKVR
jgi:hypothetical protein